ncbi:MAG TPA: ABC transporter permease [Candidatus Acidoferrales bacterium]|nr:ABC transporter permease [Candidatus Acidoferrales bacterium]
MQRIFNWFAQVYAVGLLNLRMLPQRFGSSAATVVGVAGVVTVFVAVLSIGEGFRATLAQTGSPSTALVMRTGADTEMMSLVSLEDSRVIQDAPGIGRGANGPEASPEMLVLVDVPKISTGTDANVPLRGVTPVAFEVRPKLHMLSGRRFETGRNEIIVGAGAVREFAGLRLGDVKRWGKTDWTVVGIFTDGGSVAESEIWADLDVLQGAYNRGTIVSDVYARLSAPEKFDEFKAALTSDPRLSVRVVRETDYFAEQSIFLTNLVTRLGFLIAAMMGVGAVFGAINTMYSAVATRTREIATLRALGFGGGPVVISVLAESILLAVAGGVIGGSIAYVVFNGYHTSTINWQSFSQVAFAFRVTPALLVQGFCYSVVIGLVGGLFPAIRAARTSVAAALREL